MALLEASDVSVRFGGLQALGDVSIEVDPGYVTGLIGPNGAGKTTLFNVITGLQAPSGGSLHLGGRDITTEKPHTRARLGIARTFQRLETFGTLSARDNVLVAAEARSRSAHHGRSPDRIADELLERIGLGEVASLRVDTLSTGTARLVELARALAAEPRVLLLDEPSSGLDEHETQMVGRVLLDLAADGLGVLLVEHDMAFVMSTCARIHVLDFGRVIAQGTPESIQRDPVVRAAYLGEAHEERERVVVGAVPSPDGGVAAPPPGGAGAAPPLPVLELRNVRAGYGTIEVLHGVSLQVEAGKVLALLGPNGAGKTTTLRVAGGQIVPMGGELVMLGRELNGADPDALARAGVCTIPEGRGIFPNLTVVENLRMATFAGTPMEQVTEQAFRRFPRLRERQKQLAGTMSGGEQQMLAMARALATEPAVLLVDELSMGLAPLIVEELYESVARIAAEHVSILLVEQFAHEVLGIADVAAVMLHGRVHHVGPPAEIGELLAGAYLGESAGSGATF